MPISITRLDHLVLTVRDIEATRKFYEDALGMEMRGFGDGRFAIHFGNQKLNLHESDNPIDPNVPVINTGRSAFHLGASAWNRSTRTDESEKRSGLIHI